MTGPQGLVVTGNTATGRCLVEDLSHDRGKTT